MHSTRARVGLRGWLLVAGWLVAGCGGGGGGGGSTAPTDATADVGGLRCSGGAGRGWCWQAPLPHGHWVTDVVFTGADEGWAVGDGGLVRHTRDGGVTWDERPLPGAPLLQAVRFSPDGRQGWLLGADGGRLWRSRDGGTTWTETTAAPLDFAGSLERAANGALIVRGDVGLRSFMSATRVSDDGGTSWRDPGPHLLAIDADGTQWNLLNGLDIERSDIGLSTDGGKTFQRPAAWPADRRARRLATFGDDYAWVEFVARADEADAPSLLRRGRGAPRVPPILPSPAITHGFDAQGAWVSGGRTLWHAGPAASEWAAVSPPFADDKCWAYTFVDGRTAWTRELLPLPATWITTDAGLNWVRSVPFDASGGYPVQLQRDGGGGLLMAANGSSGSFDTPLAWRRSTDLGRSWTALPGARDPERGAIAALHMLDALRGLALTPEGLLRRTDDGGRQWQRSPGLLAPARPYPLHVTMQFTPDGTGWVFNGERLYRSADGGRSWAAMELSLPQVPESLHVVDDQTAVVQAHDLCFVGHSSHPCNHRVYLSTDRAASWRATDPAWPAGAPMASLGRQHLVSAPNASSTDGGQTWQPSRVPADLAIGEFLRVVRGHAALWLLARYGLLRSNDDGASWVRVDLPLPTGHADAWPIPGPGLNDLSFADARQGWLVGDGGLVLATTDGGATWQRQASGTSTHLTSVFALGPRAVWIGSAQATVLASATGGR